MTDDSQTQALPDWPMFIGVTVDTTDPEKLADFWSALLEVPIEHRTADEIHLARQPRRGVTVSFQRVDDPTAGKNRLHLDLSPSDQDQDAEVRRVLELGARHADVGQTGDEPWVCLADPEGNEFCILGTRRP